MTGGEVEVLTDALRSHAAALDEINSGIAEATQAGGAAVGFTPVAFGILCSFFTPPAIAASTIATSSISAQGLAVSAYAGGARASAAAYDAMDSDVAKRIERLLSEITP